ncbi:hypothetical protein [Peristeroidobacter soli]|uniref:hypothetical protein n=1 Tax=Peristeroidobacter soli TaxID=2497877 RepID=UPI00101BD9D3|nr:hypothetical protein [Peristeroidobacter soli]
MLEAPVDDVIMGRLYRAHALLFVCAYLGLLGYSALTDPRDPVAALFGENSQTVEHAAAVAFAPPPSVVSKPVSRNVSGEPVASPEDTERQQERVRLSEVSQQAIRAEAPQERAAAIDQLSSATPEALQALQTVVTSDSVVRNRVRALNSLRALAEQEGAKDAVLSIVQLATSDANTGVASRANEVIRELTEQTAASE